MAADSVFELQGTVDIDTTEANQKLDELIRKATQLNDLLNQPKNVDVNGNGGGNGGGGPSYTPPTSTYGGPSVVPVITGGGASGSGDLLGSGTGANTFIGGGDVPAALPSGADTGISTFGNGVIIPESSYSITEAAGAASKLSFGGLSGLGTGGAVAAGLISNPFLQVASAATVAGALYYGIPWYSETQKNYEESGTEDYMESLKKLGIGGWASQQPGSSIKIPAKIEVETDADDLAEEIGTVTVPGVVDLAGVTGSVSYLGGKRGSDGSIGGKAKETSYLAKSSGLDYVPFDDYPVLLHEGERIMSRTENEQYNRGYGRSAASGNSGSSVAAMSIAMKDALKGVSIYMGADQVGNLTSDTVNANINQRRNARLRAMGG